jgi:NADPH:quinone reductase-like Zn-dependent oxidoreductase
MKAIVCTSYGSPDVLQLRELDTPEPAADEIRIRIQAANVFPGDCEMRRFDIHPSLWLPLRLVLGVRRPKRAILGQEFAGDVESVGRKVTRFSIGDPVFGTTGMRLGAYAQFVCLPERYVITNKPSSLSYVQAATLTVGGLNALHFIRRAHIERGDRVLIFGAAGCIGTYAVQLANLLGAQVTVVDSAEKLDLLKSLGAQHAIDYTKEDFTANGEHYDVIFDVVGKSSYARSVRSLTPTGRYLMANVGVSLMLRGVWTSLTSSRTAISALADYRIEDLDYLKSLVETGELRSVVDQTFPLAQTSSAHRYVESGAKQGHVVITMTEGAA